MENRIKPRSPVNSATERGLDPIYRLYLHRSPIAIEVYNAAGSLVDANLACLELFGVSDIKEIYGFDLFSDPNLPDEQKEKLRRGEKAQYEMAFDFDLVKKLSLYHTLRSGRVRLEVLITPMRSDAGNLIGYLTQIQDIAERTRPGDLPRQESAGVQPAPARVTGDLQKAGRGVVLILEDEEDIAVTTKEMLEASGYAAIVEPSPVRGIEIFKQRFPEIGLVLLDLTMPEMPGKDLADALREVKPGVKLIVVSGYSPGDGCASMGTTAVSGFLQKPYRLQSLMALVNSVLGQGALENS